MYSSYNIDDWCGDEKCTGQNVVFYDTDIEAQRNKICSSLQEYSDYLMSRLRAIFGFGRRMEASGNEQRRLKSKPLFSAEGDGLNVDVGDANDEVM